MKKNISTNKAGLLSHTFLIIVLSISVFGCSVAELNIATQKDYANLEKSKTFDNSYNSVWAAVAKSLSVKGYTIVSQNKDSGSISTDFLVTKEAIFLSAGRRHKVNIFVEKVSASKTKVTLTPVFEVKAADEAPWRPSRPRDTLGYEKILFSDIQSNIVK
ncbi:MAG: hypothetical protein KKI12_06210 [Proteobacteria bacterium]|nr:hypothetical protein [Pseudomonadota bacterium]MBU4257799.1 hypothetical protein [Pseudomonadota bacterium]MBU4287750.1 hypothetical protein [Pseudomonadota bacterium]MBU4414805.1 hypothetical protein [Pseudomonadota bacterium]MCG2756838.1 hypothetical protein [Desulfobacteraceae bacterium]